MKKIKAPPYSINPTILRLVGEISEWIGRLTPLDDKSLSPHLRRDNKIRTIHSSLAIENNTLTLEQVTAVLNGKRVIGLPHEIQEVRNAFNAYELLDKWTPSSRKDLLAAHEAMMNGLVDDPGNFRSGGVGIFRGNQMVHMPSPPSRVSILINNLLNWLKKTNEHPLIVGCIFHYELEFIHPFSDGNGRMGRLWQTLILYKWKPLFAYLPVETVIHARHKDYYRILAKSDKLADATPFIEFILESLRVIIEEVVMSDQASDQASDQVIRLLMLLVKKPSGSVDLMKTLKLAHRPTFRKNYLQPALASKLIERTQPDSPRSPKQQYKITEKGRQQLNYCK